MDNDAPLLTPLGRMVWTHGNGCAMVIQFNRSHYANDREPYGMIREFIGTDHVVRRGFASWRNADGARAEWRSMIARYAAKGWTRHDGFTCARCAADISDDVASVQARHCFPACAGNAQR